MSMLCELGKCSDVTALRIRKIVASIHRADLYERVFIGLELSAYTCVISCILNTVGVFF